MVNHTGLSRLRLSVLAVMSFICVASLSVRGEVTYSLAQSVLDADPAIRDQITKSAGQAVRIYNDWGSFNKVLVFRYSSSVPTANAGYNGVVTFGNSRGTKTALHEMGHTMGVGTVGGWSSKRTADNKWLGTYANEKYKQYAGPDGVLSAGSIHFWNYGLNYGDENRRAHVEVVANLREDMGIYGIVEEARPQSVATGGTAVFYIVAPQATSYAWYKEGHDQPLSDGEDFSGATTDTLTISNVIPTDEGRYYCVVSGVNLVSRPARLSVDHEEIYDRKECTELDNRTAFALEIGFKFKTGVTSPTIRALGFIDLNNTNPTIDLDGDGLLESHRVTLWRQSDGVKITEVTVPAGIVGRLINGFRYVAIPEGAITLDANTSYIVSSDLTDIQDAWLHSEPWVALNETYIGSNDRTTWSPCYGTSGVMPNNFGNNGELHGVVNISTKEILAPQCAVPANLTATARPMFVELDWSDNTEPSLHAYNVYRSSTLGGPYELVATDVFASEYTDYTLPESGTYYYVVTAMDIQATESAWSSEVSATTPVVTVIWSGAGDGVSFYQEANWVDTDTGLAPVDNTINPDTALNGGWATEYILTAHLNNVGGPLRLGNAATSLVITNASLALSGTNPMFGEGAIDLIDGASLTVQYMANGLVVNVDGTSSLTLNGGANPISGVTVNLENGAVINFLNETVADAASEHFGKIFIGGVALADLTEGVGYTHVSDGASGSIVTALPPSADFDGSGHVTLLDLEILCQAWLSGENDTHWNPACDISSPADGMIDFKDFSVFAELWK